VDKEKLEMDETQYGQLLMKLISCAKVNAKTCLYVLKPGDGVTISNNLEICKLSSRLLLNASLLSKDYIILVTL